MPIEAFQATATTTAPVDVAWEAIQRPEAWEGIAGVDQVSYPTFGADGSLVSFRMSATAAGRSYPGIAEVVESTPAASMRLHLTTSELSATIHISLFPGETDTEVAIDLEIRSRTFTAGLFFPIIADVIGRGLPAAAEDFARRMDS
jgi:hypothetical protein